MGNELHDIDRFTKVYADTALLFSADDAGRLLIRYGIERLAPAAVRQIRADCANFRLRAGEILDRFDPEQVAHAFWLERQQVTYGGFTAMDYPRGTSEALATITRTFGPCRLFVGRDGLIYMR